MVRYTILQPRSISPRQRIVTIRLTWGKLYVRIFSLRSVPLTCVLRTFLRASISRFSRRSISRARKTLYAFVRFYDNESARLQGDSECRTSCCDRESCMETEIPVGMWVSRIADSVLLTCCPPAPRDRITSTLTSFCSNRSSLGDTSPFSDGSTCLKRQYKSGRNERRCD